MTTESFDRRLAAWLDQDAQGRVLDHLAEVLVVTRATRQRPAWSSIERWLPMTTTLQQRIALQPIRPGLILAVAALLLALLAVALLAGSKKQLPVIGPAGNGLVAYVDGGQVRLASPTGQARGTVDLGGGEPIDLRWSVDGTRLAIRTTGPNGHVVVVNEAGANPVVLSRDLQLGDGAGLAWSPDSTRVAFAAEVDGSPGLYVAAADGSRLDRLPAVAGVVEPVTPAWSPDGSLIAYVLFDGDGLALHVVQPDATSDRALDTSPVGPAEMGVIAFAPDPAQRRLLYVSGNNVETPSVVKVFDLQTGVDATAGEGFWPSWSSDGSRVSWLGGAPDSIGAANVDDILAGNPTGIALQPPGSGATCQDNPDLAGRAICAPAVWSPDSLYIAGPDMVGEAIVLLPSDGSGKRVVIPLDTPTGLPGVLPAWQPVAP
jgi:hypothetical protein